MEEKSMKRSVRRHHRERLKNKRKHYYGERWSEPVVSEKEEKYWCLAIDTPTPCSCWMCGNPRHYFKGKDKRTIQELKHNITLEEELNAEI